MNSTLNEHWKDSTDLSDYYFGIDQVSARIANKDKNSEVILGQKKI